MLNKKKIQCNYALNKKKLDTGTCLKASPWNTLLSFVSLMWHVACFITSWQTCWEYDSTTLQLYNTHTHTQRLQHEYSFKDQSTEQGGSGSNAFHLYLEVPVSNSDHGPNYPDISHTFLIFQPGKWWWIPQNRSGQLPSTSPPIQQSLTFNRRTRKEYLINGHHFHLKTKNTAQSQHLNWTLFQPQQKPGI